MKCVREIAAHEGVKTITVRGKRWMTNATELMRMLEAMSQSEDWSQRKVCEEYGERMSDAIFEALMKQMRRDGRVRDGEIGAVVPIEEDALAWHWVNYEDDKEFYDDMSGKRLGPSLVRKARAEEMEA